MRLNEIAETASNYEYPMTSTQMAAQHGSDTIEYPGGSESLAAVLERAEAETFECAEDVRLTVYSSASKDAIGRRFYSDRDPVAPGENGPAQVSF
ncbi:MAG: hypothetical protein J07HR59_00487 [Halorubrum sp. J07HR59]|jgi:hypothetical protein|nr:MAG: hypothetical protein J07HR59_00487 [Halorubrum sp. J07HR59]